MLLKQPRAKWAIAAIVFLVGAIPIVTYLFQRGVFWGDEAALALNIEPRGYLEIGRPFTLRQVCPYLTAVTIKIVTAIFGTNEVAYRAVPCVATLGATGFAFAIGRKLGGFWVGVVAMGMTSTSYMVLRYSSELKQYTVDALIAGALIYATLRLLEDPESRVRLWTLGVLGALAGWFSLPSLFVMAACGIAVALEAWQSKRSAQHLAVLVGMGVFWLASFYFHFATFVEQAELTTSTGVAKYWEKSFAPFPPTSLDDFRWYIGKFFYAFDRPVDLTNRYIGGVLYLFAVALLFMERKRPQMIALVGPWVFATFAAMMNRYPPVGRLMIFMVPGITVMVAYAFGSLFRADRTWQRVVAVIVLLYMTIPGVAHAWTQLGPQKEQGDLKVALTRLAALDREGDVYYIAEGGNTVVWTYYAPHLGLPAEFFTINDPRDFEPEGHYPKLPEFAQLFGKSRAWVIAPTPWATWDPKEAGEDNEGLATFVSRYLDKCGGTQLEAYYFHEHALFLYDLREAKLPEGEARFANPRPESFGD